MSENIDITDEALNNLKQDVAAAQREAEFKKCQLELKRLKEPNEFEGVMKIPDTEQVLKTPRKRYHAIDLIVDRLGRMFAVRPVIGNIIALGLALFALYYIYHQIDLSGFGAYHKYFGIGIRLFAALQIIKSGTRSLVLPVVAVVFGTLAAHTLPHTHTLFGYPAHFYTDLSIVGIIGIGVSILSID